MFQKILLSVVLFFALAIVSFFLIVKVIDFNEYKPKIQKVVKEKTGYELVIRGDISLSLSPLGVSILDVELLNPYYKDETPFAKLGSFDIALEIIPLFQKEIKIRHIALEKMTLVIEKGKEGKYNFDIPQTKSVTEKKKSDTNTTKEDDFPLINVKNIKFGDATISYVDLVAKSNMYAEKINLNINDIGFDASKSKLHSLFFKADATISQVKVDKYTIKDVATNLDMKDAVLVAESLKYTLFDSLLQGSGKVDLSGKLPKVSVKHKIADLKLFNVSKEVLGMELLEGMANGDIKLSFSLGDALTIKNTLSGFIQLFAENVKVKGYDLDQMANALSETQNEAQGMNFITLFDARKNGNSVLKQINTKLDIGYSEVQLSDVALSTNKHRVALKGALQIVEEKILGVSIGLLDAKGCSTFEQTFVGTFSKPTLKIDEKTVKTLANTALSFLNKSKGTPKEIKTPEENCKPFYEGVIKHP